MITRRRLIASGSGLVAAFALVRRTIGADFEVTHTDAEWRRLLA